MEIAKLEAIITADIKPLTAALDEAQAEIGQFAESSDIAFLELSKNLSETSIKALQAADSIGGVEAALAILKTEQASIDQGSQKWRAYQVTIEGVEGALKQVQTTLPVVAEETKLISTSATTAGDNMAKGFSKAYSGLRQIANILPGLGISGVFLLAFDAISQAATELLHFDTEIKQVKDNVDAFNSSVAQGLGNVTSELVKVQALISAARDENLTREARNNALKEAQKLYPGYLSNINLETVNSSNATIAINNLTDALVRKAKAEGISQAISKAYASIVEAQNQSFLEQSTTIDKVIVALKSGSNAALTGINFTTQGLKRQQDTISQLQKLIDSYVASLNQITTEQSKAGDFQLLNPEKLGRAKKALKDIDDILVDMNTNIKHIPDRFINALAVETGDPFAQINKSLEKTPALIGQVSGMMDKLVKSLQDKKALAEFNKQLALMQNIAETIADTFANIFTELATTGKVSFRTLTREVISFVAEMVKAVIETAILKVLTAALTGGTSTALGGALNFAGLFGLAEGGVVSKPTVALIGESGPEAVIPLNQIAQISNNISQNLTINGLLKVQGSDLVLALNRGNVRISRNMGGNFTN